MPSGPPPEPLGLDPNFNGAPQLLRVTYGLTSTLTVFVLLRLYTRIALVKNVALDDYILVTANLFGWAVAATIHVSCNYGLGRQIYFLNPQNRTQAIKWLLISQPLGVLVGMFGRISFAVTLLRLVGRLDRWKKMILHGIIIEQVLINATFIILEFAQCGSQVNAIWDMSLATKVHCLSRNVQNDFGFFQSSASVATDLALTVIPLWMIWTVQLRLAIKVSLVFLLCLSIFAMITTIVKTIEIAKADQNPDATGKKLPRTLLRLCVIKSDTRKVASVKLLIWAEAEGVTVVIAASAAALKPLFRELAPLVTASHPGRLYQISSNEGKKSHSANRDATLAARTEGNWDVELLPRNDSCQSDRTEPRGQGSRHMSWHSHADGTIVPVHSWENEDPRGLGSREELPASGPRHGSATSNDMPSLKFGWRGESEDV
ncbi:MAG: hypothetical protein M1822_007018 [Bathelium mastoideum]|nr:MAG: hypothetical protein M1822_007018 [Bathelium mastoideum]